MNTLKESQEIKPAPPDPAITDEIIIQTMAKMDRLAFGLTIGILFGLGLFSITNFIVLQEGDPIGPILGLLGNFFYGYTVTFPGSLVGLFYGFFAGFVMGWALALLRNFVTSIYLYLVRFKARMVSVNEFIDYP